MQTRANLRTHGGGFFRLQIVALPLPEAGFKRICSQLPERIVA
jgi:hypothetical protein